MGAWSFFKPRFENLCGRPVSINNILHLKKPNVKKKKKFQLHYSGQEPLAAPAVGIGQLHNLNAKEVVVRPFALKI